MTARPTAGYARPARASAKGACLLVVAKAPVACLAKTRLVGLAIALVLTAVLGGREMAHGGSGPRARKASIRSVQSGFASWYGTPHHGRRTANGERYDMHALTAAHPALPMGTRLAVTNLENGRSVQVRVNDRGPFVRGRILDLSYAAARQLRALEDCRSAPLPPREYRPRDGLHAPGGRVGRSGRTEGVPGGGIALPQGHRAVAEDRRR